MKNLIILSVCFGLTFFLFINMVFADTCADAYANDRTAIMELQSRYLFALDFRDAETYASTFTEDGALHWARGEIKGRKAIYDFIASGIYNPAGSAEKGKWPAASRHFVTNQIIKVDGNTARSFSYWFEATNNTADRKTMVLGLFGHYEDELVKIDGQWYFKKRAIYNEGLEGRHKAGEENPAR
ncbi:MAG: nuclear transport factor 2 family protein [Deltaproteobacteria bacterium]|nr:nuclear transport factor 2 family protein [Deltaproteobacteria bacterium]